jgi:hypothetical protein
MMQVLAGQTRPPDRYIPWYCVYNVEYMLKVKEEEGRFQASDNPPLALLPLSSITGFLGRA